MHSNDFESLYAHQERKRRVYTRRHTLVVILANNQRGVGVEVQVIADRTGRKPFEPFNFRLGRANAMHPTVKRGPSTSELRHIGPVDFAHVGQR